ncbi:MAG: hypothetical protein MUE73_00640 [Planctomycetes bacterium]|jgi:hypothetical protein|nr:hypothetical protein [Planctomycetota bacterium]
MRRIPITLVVCVAVALAAMACERVSEATKSAGAAVNDAAKVTGKALDKAATATGEALEGAAESTGDAMVAADAYVNQSRIVEASRDRLQGLRTNWRDLRSKVEASGKAGETRFLNLSERMVVSLEEVDNRLAKVGDATAESWRDSKIALDSAMRKTQEIYEYAVTEFGS